MSEPLMAPAAEWPLLAPHPGTVTWQRAADARVLLAAGYALLLQVAHPTVGAGVSEHSRFQSDPWGRLLRTLDYACVMVYGGPRAAGEMGGRIRSFHRQIKGVRPDGRRYSALEPGPYAWVHATLAEGVLRAHERFAQPLPEAEGAQLWREWRALGRLLGIRERDLPADWGAFRAYVTATIDGELERTSAVDEVLEALARPAPPEMARLLRPAWPLARRQLGNLVALTTIGLLPDVLRTRFEVGLTRRQELELSLIAGALRAATPLMPPSLRNTGPGYLAWRAEAISRGEVASGTLSPAPG